MPRVKRGVTARARHKKVLAQAAGFTFEPGIYTTCLQGGIQLEDNYLLTEHKLENLFSDADMNAMLSVRAAFDPLGLCNPGKIIPMLRGCGEGRAVALAPSNESDPNGFPVQLPRETKPDIKVLTSFDPENAAKVLSTIVGADHVRAVESSLVVHPSSVAELVELVKCAAFESWSITPAGGMTWIPQPPTSNLVISTSRLNRIIEHEPADLIAIAESGVRLTDFNDELSRNGQWLPLDPPDDGRATLGGVVATGLGGAHQFAFGQPRASVIGMKVVLADGSLIKAGGRVVKNVAGYDLCKLFTGSQGMLGVITEINFKLRPKPLKEQTIVAFGRISELISSAQRILESRLFPVAIELVSSALAKRLGFETDTISSALLVRFAGNRKGVEYQTQQALAELNTSTELVADDLSLWRAIAALPVEGVSSWRASVLPSNGGDLLAQVEETYGSKFNSMLWHLGIADGRLRVIEKAGRELAPVQQSIQSLNGRLFVETPGRIDVSKVPMRRACCSMTISSVSPAASPCRTMASPFGADCRSRVVRSSSISR
jgi:FAD/FMN-containing dehydrogenase